MPVPSDIALQLLERGITGTAMLAVAIIGWFLVRTIKGVDKGIEKVGEKLEKIDEKLSGHTAEIGKLQVRMDNAEVEIARVQDDVDKTQSDVDQIRLNAYQDGVHPIRRNNKP